MPELTDAQKVMRNDTGKSIAEAIANMSITVAGQEIEVSDTEPQSKFVDVWFQEQQQGAPVEVYTVPEINDMIAPAETSPTQAAHHVGEYIICVLNGQAKLYKVIAEISAGETLTVGTNIRAVKIGDVISAMAPETILFSYNMLGIVFARNNSTQRLVQIPIPVGYNNISTDIVAGTVLGAREFEKLNPISFTVTGVSYFINGPFARLTIEGTGLENYNDVLSGGNIINITLSK